MHRSASVHFFIDSSRWSGWHLLRARYGVLDHQIAWDFFKIKEKSHLQTYFHEIRCLHPNFSIEVLNILSLISHHSIFILQVDPVSNFKHMNVKLQTSKLSKDGSKWKMCTPSTNFRWSQATMMSSLLWKGLENSQLSQPW
jgi:hypothetical protein